MGPAACACHTVWVLGMPGCHPGAAFRDLHANKKCSVPSMQTGASEAGTCSIPFPWNPPLPAPWQTPWNAQINSPIMLGCCCLRESRKSSCHPGCSDKATASFLCWCPIIANARQLDGLGGFRLGSWCSLATELAVAVFMQIICVQSKHLEKAKAPGSDIWCFFPLMKQK